MAEKDIERNKDREERGGGEGCDGERKRGDGKEKM